MLQRHFLILQWFTSSLFDAPNVPNALNAPLKLLSLWNVNDKATASLMQHVYAGMLQTHKTTAASLRAAQIEMLREPQSQSPYYSAAFVLQGEWN